MRAEPTVKTRVLGKLPPPNGSRGWQRKHTEGGWLTEFRIIGFKDGWFLIEGATPPGKEYEDEKKYPRNAPKPYAGRGWVAANKVGANTPMAARAWAGCSRRRSSMRSGCQRSASSAGRSTQRRAETPARLQRALGSGGSHDGVRGWWRSLCSSQVTNLAPPPPPLLPPLSPPPPPSFLHPGSHERGKNQICIGRPYCRR